MATQRHKNGRVYNTKTFHEAGCFIVYIWMRVQYTDILQRRSYETMFTYLQTLRNTKCFQHNYVRHDIRIYCYLTLV
jgi:hypothetical protein